jgi:hypothetical protein
MSPSPHPTKETVSETLCFLYLEFRTLDGVHKPSNSGQNLLILTNSALSTQTTFISHHFGVYGSFEMFEVK